MRDERRWRALRAKRDAPFFFAVKTTGVYCRPSCGARLPRRENVSFFESARDAEAAGYRPCKRCRPNEPSKQARDVACIATACRAIDDAEVPPALNALAEAAGMSPSHFHRLFRRVTGVTPKAYADAQRAERFKRHLKDGGSVTRAIYDAGFNASSRFYARASKHLGMTATRYRGGGDAMSIGFAVGTCSLGEVLVAMTEQGICAILLGDDRESLVHDLRQRFPKAHQIARDKQLARHLARVVKLIEHPARGPSLPLDIRGTVFQRRVWEALGRVRPGTTTTYGELARAIGAPTAARAVARACAANPAAVAIPCHRVVRGDGAPGGYRWGSSRKRQLLAREAADKDTR